MKKVVVLGGGKGLSTLLRGLKQFPLDITAVVTVADDGGSSGKLRNEFNIPAIGDLRNVLVSLSESSPLFEQLLQYRFETDSDLNGHPIGNLILAALVNIMDDTTEAVSSLATILNLKGKVFPLTCEAPILIAHTKAGDKIYGESSITASREEIHFLEYEKEPKIVPEVLLAIEEADLVIFGIGSLYTSLIPNILSEEMRVAITKTNAKKMYVSNIMTEHGETDNFNVSDCINVVNTYMKGNVLDVVIANNGSIKQDVLDRYKTEENSEEINLDSDIIFKHNNLELIEDNLVSLIPEINPKNTEEIVEMIRHDYLKTAFLIFSYLLEK